MSRLILIAGGSAAGKSTLARQLASRFREAKVCVFSHDAYYHDVSHLPESEMAHVNFDHPDAIEHSLLIEDVKGMLDGKQVFLPRYDYLTHAREHRATPIGPVEVVIVEGIFALCYPALTELADLRVFVDTDPDVRLMRRLRRDVRARGFTFEAVLAAYESMVKPMHEAHVEPSRRRADLIVPGNGSGDRAFRLLDAYVRSSLATHRNDVSGEHPRWPQAGAQRTSNWH